MSCWLHIFDHTLTYSHPVQLILLQHPSLLVLLFMKWMTLLWLRLNANAPRQLPGASTNAYCNEAKLLIARCAVATGGVSPQVGVHHRHSWIWSWPGTRCGDHGSQSIIPAKCCGWQTQTHRIPLQQISYQWLVQTSSFLFLLVVCMYTRVCRLMSADRFSSSRYKY